MDSSGKVYVEQFSMEMLLKNRHSPQFEEIPLILVSMGYIW